MPGKKSQKKGSAVPPTMAKSAAKPAVKPAETKAVNKTEETTALPTKPASIVAVLDATPAAIVPAPVAHSTTIASDQSLDRMIADLGDSSADVARDAATALGERGDTLGVEPLIAALNNVDGFFHSVVRAAAASSLGKIRDPRATLPLIGALEDPMAEASAEAVRALALLNDSRAIEPLLGVLRNTGGFYAPIVRRAAILALAQLGGDEAVTQIKAIIGDEFEEPSIRDAARQAIA